jgi:TPR repeat protein
MSKQYVNRLREEIEKLDNNIDYREYEHYLRKHCDANKVLQILKEEFKDNLTAIYFIGYIYQYILKKHYEATEYYEYAAEQGNIHAMEHLALIKIRTNDIKTYKKYFKMLKICVKAGKSLSKFRVGMEYLQSKFLKKNEAKALKYFKEVDELKSLHRIKFDLARLYLFAEDEKVRDERRGVIMLKVMAEQRRHNLAVIGELLGTYYMNKGTDADLVESLKWLRIGIKRKSKGCEGLLMKLLSNK